MNERVLEQVAAKWSDEESLETAGGDRAGPYEWLLPVELYASNLPGLLQQAQLDVTFSDASEDFLREAASALLGLSMKAARAYDAVTAELALRAE
jgi:hypothetical protein